MAQKKESNRAGPLIRNSKPGLFLDLKTASENPKVDHGGLAGNRSASGRLVTINVRAVSEANRRDRFGWLGPQEFAFDTAV
jgi:hypothetical protein